MHEYYAMQILEIKKAKAKAKKKKKKKRKQNVFCISFLDLKSRLANLFLHKMFMYFVSLDELIYCILLVEAL